MTSRQRPPFCEWQKSLEPSRGYIRRFNCRFQSKYPAEGAALFSLATFGARIFLLRINCGFRWSLRYTGCPQAHGSRKRFFEEAAWVQ